MRVSSPQCKLRLINFPLFEPYGLRGGEGILMSFSRCVAKKAVRKRDKKICLFMCFRRKREQTRILRIWVRNEGNGKERKREREREREKRERAP